MVRNFHRGPAISFQGASDDGNSALSENVCWRIQTRPAGSERGRPKSIGRRSTPMVRRHAHHLGQRLAATHGKATGSAYHRRPPSARFPSRTARIEDASAAVRQSPAAARGLTSLGKLPSGKCRSVCFGCTRPLSGG